MNDEDRNVLLHILRNPHGYSQETIREMRMKACDELERLWRQEGRVRIEVECLSKLIQPKAASPEQPQRGA